MMIPWKRVSVSLFCPLFLFFIKSFNTLILVIWICSFIGSYKKFVPKAASVSKDGTVLAVSFNNTITLWDAFTFTIKRTLQCMPSNENVKHILFTNDEPFLVSTTDTFLYVWNILTCEGENLNL